jgi:GDP-D-mannose dehydratase
LYYYTLYINVIEEYVVSSIGSEALQIKINTNVTATIGDTNVELWWSYIKDDVDYMFYIKMEARNETSEEYL